METYATIQKVKTPIQFYFFTKYAGVAELADAPDLGSGGTPVQVQVLSPVPSLKALYIKALGIFYCQRKNTHNKKAGA